jgi:hypothetical protein
MPGPGILLARAAAVRPGLVEGKAYAAATAVDPTTGGLETPAGESGSSEEAACVVVVRTEDRSGGLRGEGVVQVAVNRESICYRCAVYRSYINGTEQ